MSSQINPSNIDTTFPIAGQDNDTQGFRTNYINIRNNLITAAQEITALQANVNLLTASTSSSNIVATLISTPVGSSANIVLNPDGVADVVITPSTELYVQSNATATSTTTGAMVVSGGVGVAGNVYVGGYLTLQNAIQYANLTTAQIANITPTVRGMTVYNYSSGNIQVYNGTKWANITLS